MSSPSANSTFHSYNEFNRASESLKLLSAKKELHGLSPLDEEYRQQLLVRTTNYLESKGARSTVGELECSIVKCEIDNDITFISDRQIRKGSYVYDKVNKYILETDNENTLVVYNSAKWHYGRVEATFKDRNPNAPSIPFEWVKNVYMVNKESNKVTIQLFQAYPDEATAAKHNVDLWQVARVKGGKEVLILNN